MSWFPTTRGTEKNDFICHHGSCGKANTVLAHYVVDDDGIRYFCEEHWGDVMLFFADVASCFFCKRNHHAEYDKAEIKYGDVKFSGRWWSLCIRHRLEYDEMICDFMGGLHLATD